MKIVLMLMVASVCVSTLSQAAEYVVGSDAEFAAVQTKVQPGDIVRIKPGQYGDLKWEANGAPGKPIIVLGMNAKEYAKKDVALERKVKSLSFGGAHTIISGLRIVGGKDHKGKTIYNACSLVGRFIRLTNCTFARCAARTFCNTGKGSYEVEIDHCDFSGKDPKQYGGGQTMRLFTGDSKYPAGHVIHHNQFGPQASYVKKNGGETIQSFSAGGKKHGRLGDYTFEEDYLIMCNLITRGTGENEEYSGKCDSSFLLLNTFRRTKEINFRIGRNHTMEANFFVESCRAPRSCGANNLFRNNYIQQGSAPFKLWGKASGYSGVRDNWIVNNTFAASAPYTAKGTLQGDVYLVNNFIGSGYKPSEGDAKWKRHANIAIVPVPKEGEVPEPLPELSGVTRYPFDSLMELDRTLPCKYKGGKEYVEAGTKDAFIFKLKQGSALKGVAATHQFVGGLDPRGNPVPATGGNIGALQEGRYNIFKPLDVGDVGPFTAKGRPPVVKITAPSEDASIDGAVNVKVQASDPEGKLAYVYLMLNNQPVSVDAKPPFEWTLDKMLLAHGNRIRAVAFDMDGNTAFHRVNVMNSAKSRWVRNTKLEDYPAVVPQQ